MKEEELKPYYRKRIRVTFIDGTEMIGFFESYNSKLDNDPELPSIDLRNDKNELYELYLAEINRMEILN